jgi:hypothetical protein
MSFDPGTTPSRNDTQWWILQKILASTNAGGSGGSGPATTGANYRFSGSGVATELQLKNSTTGLFNDISSVGADGTQSVVLGNGEA